MVKSTKLKEDLADVLGVPSQWLNKYTLVTGIFMVWVIFFDKHNIFAYQKLKGSIARMEMQKEELGEAIEKAQKDKENLLHNQEGFARSIHLMAKPDEEIIIIERK